MEQTISDGARTNIFPNIADHAGPKELHLHQVIDSIFYSEIKTQLQLILMLKQLLTAELEDLAKEETQEEFMNMLSKKVSQIHHVNNTLLRILINHHAKQLIFAKIAHGHHAQQTNHAKTNAGLLNTNTTMQATTTQSMELQR